MKKRLNKQCLKVHLNCCYKYQKSIKLLLFLYKEMDKILSMYNLFEFIVKITILQDQVNPHWPAQIFHRVLHSNHLFFPPSIADQLRNRDIFHLTFQLCIIPQTVRLNSQILFLLAFPSLLQKNSFYLSLQPSQGLSLLSN
ncbi:hypothetical protein FGO68_gene1700 [Halteria grandinella]|uniref:Uncharacterized protein n=1 Tax=Halteria grandinella TaxID=5974 RepID=A0A8J8SYL2_HALGN|nr:hypothetical protein FGO68_gene1700 [Halteria grandinella]